MELTKRNNFLVLWQSFLAFSSYVSAAGLFSDIIDPRWGAAILVVNGGLAQATGVWVAASKPIVEAQDPSRTP